MKTLYLDCGMGAAGDMLTAALLELCPDRETAVEKLNQLGIPGAVYRAEPAEKCGITGTHMQVLVRGEEEVSCDVMTEEIGGGARAHGHVHEYSHGHGHEHGCDHEHEHNCGSGHEHGHEHDHNQDYDSNCGHEHGHEHGHDHGHDHEYEHSHEYEHGHEHDHDHDHEHSHEYEHDHEHEHGHERDHDHDHEHSREYEHGHEHNHDHEHNHEYSHNHEHSHSHVHAHGHHHSSMRDIRQIINHLNASEQVKKDALAVYQLIAEAESKVHGKTVEEIHFHEVGTMDAVADVAGVCFLMEELKIGAVYASYVHVGSGHVHCAHGILPVPAPATALLLQGIPIYGGNIRGELCTPTGAAILKHFVKQFGPMPPMTVERIGYGMGKKDFEAANCVRALLSQDQDEKTQDMVVELRCNLDDMSGEELGYASELLLREGALDVYTAGVSMKKSRPGVLLVCLCREADAERLEKLIFRHTTTLGIRKITCQRTILTRRQESMETEWGTVRKKVSELPGTDGLLREKLEYEDLAAIADQTGLSIAELRRRILEEKR